MHTKATSERIIGTGDWPDLNARHETSDLSPR
jgi:hypothetical protein